VNSKNGLNTPAGGVGLKEFQNELATTMINKFFLIAFCITIFSTIGSRTGWSIVWDGQGSNSLWTTAENWVGDITPTFDNSLPVVFGGNLNLSPLLHDNITVKSLAFNSTASSFSLGDATRTITLDNNSTILATVLTQASPNSQTISNNLILTSSGGGELALSASGANLTLNGSVTISQTTQFNASASGIYTLNGSLQGSGRFIMSGNQITLTSPSSSWDNTNADPTAPAILISAGQLILNGNLGTTSAGLLALGSNSASTAYNARLYYNNATASMTKSIVVRASNQNTSTAVIGIGSDFTGSYTIESNIIIGGSSGVTGLTANRTANLEVTTDDKIGTDIVTFTGVISTEPFAYTVLPKVTKTGKGTVIFSGNNSYVGQTIVSAGKLVINGNQSLASGIVTVASGAILGGSGTIGGATSIAAGGTLAPGNSIGILTLANSLSLADGALLSFELGAPGTNDLVSMMGQALALNNQEFGDFAFLPQSGFDVGTYTLFDAGTISGTLGATTSGIINYNGTDYNAALAVAGNDLVLNVTAIPEPSTLVLGGIGLLGFAGLRLRRRSKF
jgi:fibronectin-binding autotransporter adhesin